MARTVMIKESKPNGPSQIDESLMFIEHPDQALRLRRAVSVAFANLEYSGSKITTISVSDGRDSTPAMRLRFWQLLVDGIFLHPRFGYLRVPDSSPIQIKLGAMGISEAFVDALHDRLQTTGRATLALVIWQPRTAADVKSVATHRFLLTR